MVSKKKLAVSAANTPTRTNDWKQNKVIPPGQQRFDKYFIVSSKKEASSIMYNKAQFITTFYVI